MRLVEPLPDLSPALQAALKQAAWSAHPPVLLMVAQNDATTEAITALAKIFEIRKHPYQLKIYPPFIPPPGTPGIGAVTPGHLIFGPAGVPVWSSDVLGFLARYVK